MKKKVTIQDIADVLGMSRNTISKAINNADGIAESTRTIILQKAAEMGYKTFSYSNIANSVQPAGSSRPEIPDGPTEIALFTTFFLNYSHFASTMLDKFQQELSLLGYTLNTHRVTQKNRDEGTLPATFNKERSAAIVCVEMFDRDYDELVCKLGLPVLFIDGPAKLCGKSLPADQLYMENTGSITRLVCDMLDKGIRQIGFVGDYEHCQSFYERYTAFRYAMLMADIPVNDRFILRAINYEDVRNQMKDLDIMPELFLCANDFLAIDTVRILEDKGFSVPDDVLVSGFDDSAESRLVSPRLTTVHIHTQSMAVFAIQLLMTRLREPSLDYRIVYSETYLIYRESTGFMNDDEDTGNES